MTGPSVLTIGNFDGVHLGHRSILQRCHELGASIDPKPRVVTVTFDPPPTAVLRPGSEPPQVDSLRDRVSRLSEAGAEHVEVLHVDENRLHQSARAFIEEMVERFAPVAIVEGPDFRFGHRRQGDQAMLEAVGRDTGFHAHALPRAHATLGDRQTVPVSSSLIRWLVGRGRVSDAAACLGRPFELAGRVVRGEQRGRTIGIPTANLDPADLAGRILPADGVYAATAHAADGTTYPAAVSVGTKPTFHDQARTTVEAHLIGFTGDLYDQTLTIRFVRWVRDQYAFPGRDALVTQLRRDVERAEHLTNSTPDPHNSAGPTTPPLPHRPSVPA
ncbi:MAG: riboflavin biosynthesis protein RibF [Planctomycetota bacterium]